jgi:hypothetical protein
MTTSTAILTDERSNQAGTRLSRPDRRARRGSEEENAPGTRFFLSKPGTNGSALELAREFSSEGEARVEALKAGVTYFSVQEWRPIADFAGKNPELKREAVTRKGANNTQE